MGQRTVGRKLLEDKDNSMLAVVMKRLCRVGLAAVLVTALCVLTLVDMPLQLLPESQTDSPPTPGNNNHHKLSNFFASHQLKYFFFIYI